MTNYETLMSNMSPETLADLLVKVVLINNECIYYVTSTGQLFPMDKHIDALQYEYNWLMTKLSEEEKPVESNIDTET